MIAALGALLTAIGAQLIACGAVAWILGRAGRRRTAPPVHHEPVHPLLDPVDAARRIVRVHSEKQAP
jgi:hypothetical protein